MTREHTPKPGANWGRELVRRELLATDGPVPTEWAQAFADSLAADPQQTALNRADRRRAERAKRKGSTR
jgi:hypothetical protein